VFRYGFIPSFEKNEKPKMVFHNARFESVAEKPSFRNAFLKQRCLVPLDAFYEYVHEGEERRGLGRFQSPGGEMLTAAGIFHHWKSPSGGVIPTFAILTREASPFLLKSGHDRSPFFLTPEGMESWIQPEVVEPEALKSILLDGALVPDLEVEIER
jgi:putative SOS response-associated peptidase YedK